MNKIVIKIVQDVYYDGLKEVLKNENGTKNERKFERIKKQRGETGMEIKNNTLDSLRTRTGTRTITKKLEASFSQY